MPNGDSSSDASHELRAPLAVVRAETDLALRRDRSAEEYRSALESIDRETTRLQELVDDLLQTMRHQTLAETQRIDVRAVVAGVAGRMRRAAARIDVEDQGISSAVYADPKSLERALSAVLHNALIHGGGEVLVSLGGDPDVVRITVADAGPGFSADAINHATERFWRGDSARSRGSTGLGLSIARILVEAHGGALTLANGAGGGAVVSLVLPRARAPAVSN